MMELSGTYLPPARFPSLDRGEIHVWIARLDLITHPMQTLFSTLSPDERARSEKYRFEKDRNRYVTSRGILRSLLGQYLNVPAAKLNFSYGSSGKPFLAPESLSYPIHFSVSHSCGLALFGFSRNQEIGIDLERVRQDLEFERMAKAYFPPGEFSELRSLAPAGRSAEFFRLWTRFEAYAKARGIGLSLLDGFVASSPLEADRVSPPVRQCEDISGWTIDHFSPELNYIAALASKIRGSNLKQWHYAFSLQQ